MDAHGYLFKGKAGSSLPDLYPSLIGALPGSTNASNGDAYFDRIDLADRTVKRIIVSKWLVWDNGAAAVSDPILQVQSPAGTYYIPKSELEEIAAANHDDDTWEMLAALFPVKG